MHGCSFRLCVIVSERYSRQFSSSLLSEQSSSSSHLHMVGIHLLLLHWNCPSSHSVSAPVSAPVNNGEENYSRPRQITCPAHITISLLLHNNTWLNRANPNTQLGDAITTRAIQWSHDKENEGNPHKSVSFSQCCFRRTCFCSDGDAHETINANAAKSSSFNNLLVFLTTFFNKCFSVGLKAEMWKQDCNVPVASRVFSLAHPRNNQHSIIHSVHWKSSGWFHFKKRL